MSYVRILLADDHTIVRQGLRRILESEPGWEVIAEAEDGRRAVQLALELQPDVAVLDIGMPRLNGIETTRQLASQAPSIRILILSMHSAETFITRALQAGAQGYLLKDAADTDLIKGVSAVAEGKSFLSPAASSAIRDTYRHCRDPCAEADGYNSLTECERELLQLVVEGRTDNEIAGLLSMRVTTVETHRTNILRKLDVPSTAELVLFAVRHGVMS